MLVFYSKAHTSHAPRTEVWGGHARPHPEVPGRAEAILAALGESHRIRRPPEAGMEELILAHSRRYVEYVERTCQHMSPGDQAFPFAFPRSGDPPDNAVARRGFFCYDTVTPLCRGTFSAALSSAGCALAGSRYAIRTGGTAYCLCRPPGHHASHEMMAGYCYFNNSALAALKTAKRAAILDIDSHHGNGTQEIFFRSKEVLTCSIHGDPRTTFPYAWGYERESGEGEGAGFNVNAPLPAETAGRGWLAQVVQLLSRVRDFQPDLLIVPLGLDGLSEDRNGAFRLKPGDYAEAGRLIAAEGVPTCILQEGGYCVDQLGVCVAGFLLAFD